VPETVSPEDASLCTLAEVALNGVRRAGCPLGARCAVLGLGLVGQLAARFLGIGGAEEVVVFDPIAERRMLVPPAPPFIIEEYPEEIPRARFDIVIEASGSPEAMTLGASLARSEGTISVVSSPRSPVLFDFHDDCNRRSLNIVGSHYFSHPPEGARRNAHDNGDYFLSLLAQQRITVRGLVSEIVRPERVVEKYASLEGTTARPGFLIDWRRILPASDLPCA
jgi:threonine dehydrogenase-like Zn-dependent dehydrogenase